MTQRSHQIVDDYTTPETQIDVVCSPRSTTLTHDSNISVHETTQQGLAGIWQLQEVLFKHKVSLCFGTIDQTGQITEIPAAFGHYPATLLDVTTVDAVTAYLSDHLETSLNVYGLGSNQFTGLMARFWNPRKYCYEFTRVVRDSKVWDSNMAAIPTYLGLTSETKQAQKLSLQNARTIVYIFFHHDQVDMRMTPNTDIAAISNKYYNDTNTAFTTMLQATDQTGYNQYLRIRSAVQPVPEAFA